MSVDVRICEHDLAQPSDHRGQRRLAWVLAITLVTMVGELLAGWLTGSMALLADGWHMGTHATAFGVALLAARYALRHRDNPRFAFGTGKVGSLAGFGSAVALALAALAMASESVHRLLEPQAIRFDEALVVAVIGLGVNVVGAVLLGGGHDHHHDHDAGHDHGPHRDHNLRAAYLHVLADALTSVLAIAALAAGKWLGWAWLDAAIGLLGALVIAMWSIGLLRASGRVLLDVPADPHLAAEIRSALAAVGDAELVDLHVWQLREGRYAAIIALMASGERDPQIYRRALEHLPQLVHVTVELRLAADDA